MRAGRQHESVSGLAKRDLVNPLADMPMSGAGIEMCQQPRVGCDRHATRLAGMQLNSLEAEEANAFLAGRFGQINLCHIGTCARPRIGNRESRGNRLTAGDSAIAWPPASPGYHASRMVLTLLSHGMATGLPVSSTTMVFGLAETTASISASWPKGSDRSGLSRPSLSGRMAKTMATSERRASSAALTG